LSTPPPPSRRHRSSIQGKREQRSRLDSVVVRKAPPTVPCIAVDLAANGPESLFLTEIHGLGLSVDGHGERFADGVCPTDRWITSNVHHSESASPCAKPKRTPVEDAINRTDHRSPIGGDCGERQDAHSLQSLDQVSSRKTPLRGVYLKQVWTSPFVAADPVRTAES